MKSKQHAHGGKPDDALVRSTAVVATGTMVSRLLGFARDIVMLALLGGTMATDAVVIAFTFPNLFRRMLGEGGANAAVVPVFQSTIEKDGEREAFAMLRTVIFMISGILLALTVGIMAIAWLAENAFDSPRLQLTARLTRIVFPYVLFICLFGLLAGILNCYGAFLLTSVTPAMLNVLWIAGCYIAVRYTADGQTQAVVLIYFILVAGIVQFCAMLPGMYAAGFRWIGPLTFSSSQVKKVVALFVPAAVGLSVTQINVVVDRLLALFLGEGMATAIYSCERLIQLPLGVIGIALATVSLPLFSMLFARGETEKFRITLEKGLEVIFFLFVPVVLTLMLFAEPLVAMAFERGNFLQQDTREVAWALYFYAPALLSYGLVRVLVPAFYAQQDIRTPVKISIICVVVNVVLNLILMWPLRQGGLALASSISSFLNVTLLARAISKRNIAPRFAPLGRSLLNSVWMSLVSVTPVFLIYKLEVVPWYAWKFKFPVVYTGVHLLVAVAGYLVLAFICLRRAGGDGRASE